MHIFWEIIHNPILPASMLSWIIAQFLKIPIHCIIEHKWNWKHFCTSGGMPSSHSALITSTVIMIGAHYGYDSGTFALGVAIAFIVMYDAMGVRRETGRQAVIINQILHDVLVDGKPISDQQLRVLMGHKPIEVACGVLLGLIIAVVFLILQK